jgi:hypothetical protein
MLKLYAASVGASSGPLYKAAMDVAQKPSFRFEPANGQRNAQEEPATAVSVLLGGRLLRDSASIGFGSQTGVGWRISTGCYATYIRISQP